MLEYLQPEGDWRTHVEISINRMNVGRWRVTNGQLRSEEGDACYIRLPNLQSYIGDEHNVDCVAVRTVISTLKSGREFTMAYILRHDGQEYRVSHGSLVVKDEHPPLHQLIPLYLQEPR